MARVDESHVDSPSDLPLVVSGHNVEPHFWMMGTRTSAAPGTPLAWRISTDAPNDLVDAFEVHGLELIDWFLLDEERWCSVGATANVPWPWQWRR